MLSGPTRPPATTGQFQLAAPADRAMVTTTRRPGAVLGRRRRRGAVPGLDQHQPYRLRLHRVRAPARTCTPRWPSRRTTSYTPSWDLPDRWTYQWFVVSVSASNATTTSNIRTFSVYVPTVSSGVDGVRVINGSRDLNKNGTIEPYEDFRQPVETRVNDLLAG
jgi:hypothetical protein